MTYAKYLLGISVLLLTDVGLADDLKPEYQYDGIKQTICDDRLPDQEARVACYLDYTSPNHPDNQPNVPLDCQDPEPIYQPIRYIYTQNGSYNDRENARLEQPISAANGMIKHDFSADQLPDYVFLERKGENIRLVACVSSTNSLYQRVATQYIVREFNPKQYDIGAPSDTIQRLTTGQLSIYSGYYEHNTGSYATTSIYGWSAKRKAFSLEQLKTFNYRGDGYDANRDYDYDFKHLRYQKIDDCSRAQPDIGCDASTIATGNIRLLKLPPLLGAGDASDYTEDNGFKLERATLKPYTAPY